MLTLDQLQTRLAQLDSAHSLRALFADWSYEADFSPVFLKQAGKADERAQECLADDPEIIARAGDFHVIYAPLREFDKRAIGSERLIISRLLNEHPFALWIFSNEEKTQWHFVNVKRGAGQGASAMSRHILRRYSFARGELPGRTSVEQLRKIDLESLATLPGIEPGALAVQDLHDKAFDVEAVTRDFFRDYKAVFEGVEAKVKIEDESTRRLWTQRLFNRLMFLRFLEKKGWLEFDDDRNYLRALFKAAKQNQENFLDDRLYYSFFFGLNMAEGERALHKHELLETRRGKVPFLNGGLFDRLDEYDVQGRVTLDNSTFNAILDLFDRYNFTIHESTPFDQEIGIDPEMLGKVFEELVTGRHESGSYYTPRGIVSFMAREALKGYLEQSERPEAIRKFVDEGDATALSDPEKVLSALREVKICDPACGSGAYLLGMMQELLRLREALFAAKAKDHQSIYRRKLEIIENNLYGADKDPFAVNIAMLRLWLSLIIDYEGDVPPPLPNLRYKVGEGDSLAAPLAGAEQLVMHEEVLREFVEKKGEYLRAHGEDKKTLQNEIEALRDDIRLWTHQGEAIQGFDWVVEFAEVFAGSRNSARATALAQQRSRNSARATALAQQRSRNSARATALAQQRSRNSARATALAQQRGTLAGSSSALTSGFDIVLANPPYVRQELIKEQKPQLKKIFGANFSGTADLYVYFYLRAHELLRPGGMIAFISPNKWFRAAYGAKLRKYFAERTTVRSITDFGDLPVFQAATAYPMVFIAQKSETQGQTMFAQIKSLAPPYPDVRALMDEYSAPLPEDALDGQNWNLADAATSTRLASMRKAGTPLGEYVKGQIYRGVLTGFNEAFVIDGATRDRLIAQDKRSTELIKPLVAGRDIRKWTVDYKDKWLIVTKIGVPIKEYSVIFKHLKQWQPQLEKRLDQGNHWWELRACAYYDAFDKPKILYPDIAAQLRFAFDTKGVFMGNTAYFTPTEDLYLLGVLNTPFIEEMYLEMSAQIRGGYIRFFTQYVERLPIPTPPPSDRSAIETLVEACLQKRGVDCEGEEAEINARVAKLYGLA